jgi:hypothetical protein
MFVRWSYDVALQFVVGMSQDRAWELLVHLTDGYWL